jgi:hypothetical protein
VQGALYLDKRDNSTFDLLSVSETAQEPPTANDDVADYNHPAKLAVEATAVNQNFSQQILMEVDGERKTVSFRFGVCSVSWLVGCTSSINPALCFV